MKLTRWRTGALATLLLCLAASANPKQEWAIERIDNHLTRSVERGFAGVMLIASGNNVVLKKGYGLADRDKQRPLTSATLMDIGSVTKQFTAAAILVLAQQQSVSVDDTLAKYFPGVPEDKQGITLHQLLTHTSGLPGGLGVDDFTHLGTEQFFDRLLMLPLHSAPGETYHYSNIGYSVLARVIELASGQTYEQFVQTRLFAPANMQHTGYLYGKAPEVIATGYKAGLIPTSSNWSRYQRDQKVAWALKGNGGIVSTIDDMFNWYLALRNHVVLSAQQVERLTTGYVSEGGPSQYGYGWSIAESPSGQKMAAHNGSDGVFYFDFRWLQGDDQVILFASNALVNDTPGMSESAELMLFDEVFNPPAFRAGPVHDILRLSLTWQSTPQALAKAVAQRFDSALNERYVLNRAGLALMDSGHHQAAIALLDLNVKRFKDDGNLWDSLGEAYLAANQPEDAKRCFVNALVLAPEQQCYWCDNAKSRLTQIKQASKS